MPIPNSSECRASSHRQRTPHFRWSQTEGALRPIPNIPAADQEFWTQVLWGVHNYFDVPNIPNHAERAAQTISQFNTAMLRLKERAPLELNHVSFCRKIDGYGEFDT